MAKVIVVDDDPLVGDLTRFLLKDAGHEVMIVEDSRQALAAVKAEKPDLVLLDLLMPGVDGLTLCRRIREDADLKGLKVAVVSAKAFTADREKAKACGADAFIQKPYKVNAFPGQIQAILDGAPFTDEPAAPAAAGFSPAPDAKLEIQVWGCRSLSPQLTGSPSRYGRHTSCVSVLASDRLFIFDAGGGLHALGAELLSRPELPRELWMFVTHFHQDHIEGLGLFPCMREPGFTLNLCGANDASKSLQEMAREAFERTLAGPEPVQAKINLFELQEEAYEMLPGVTLTPFYANHPGTTLGFILELEGRKLVYSPDSEVYGEAATALQDYDERVSRLCAGADIMIHDGRYTDGDYQTRKNAGHSSFLNAVALAARAKAKRLVLFHLDDAYGDALLDEMEAQAKQAAALKGVECVIAREGLKISL